MNSLLDEMLTEKPKTVIGYVKKAVCVTGYMIGYLVGIIVFLAIIIGILCQSFL